MGVAVASFSAVPLAAPLTGRTWKVCSVLLVRLPTTWAPVVAPLLAMAVQLL